MLKVVRLHFIICYINKDAMVDNELGLDQGSQGSHGLGGLHRAVKCGAPHSVMNWEPLTSQLAVSIDLPHIVPHTHSGWHV